MICKDSGAEPAVWFSGLQAGEEEEESECISPAKRCGYAKLFLCCPLATAAVEHRLQGQCLYVCFMLSQLVTVLVILCTVE